MAAKTDVLIPALEDARDAHAAVVDRFWTGATLTPPGTDRQRLESQASEAQYCLGRIDARMREMRPPRGPLSAAGQLMRMVTRGAVRVSVLPLQAGMSAVTEIVRGKRPADERRLLRAAEDEYTAAARALATCQAGKDIAERLNDQETAELLAILGRQGEVLLETGEENLARWARAVAAAAEGPRPPQGETVEGDSRLQAITRQVRAATARLRALPQRVTGRMRGPGGGAWREMTASSAAASASSAAGVSSAASAGGCAASSAGLPFSTGAEWAMGSPGDCGYALGRRRVGDRQVSVAWGPAFWSARAVDGSGVHRAVIRPLRSGA
ncbi:hypothetical protein ACWCRF_38160 [Streptomyces sp. NPDC002405]